MRQHNVHRRGVALIMVLIVIALLSLGAYTFTDLMVAQQHGTMMSGRRAKVQAAVASGVEYIKDYLILEAIDQETVGGHYDNPAYFQDVIVATEPEGTIRFSVISIVEDQYGEPSGIRFGLLDEGTRININHVVTSDAYKGDESSEEMNESPSSSGDSGDASPSGAGPPSGDTSGGDESGGDEPEAEFDGGLESDPLRDALMVLPGMTEDLADAILDWIDEDDEPRTLGAESIEYAYLGYEPRNGPINSLDELLLVRGMTPELLYGADRNHNGLIDDSEQDIAALTQALGTTGSMDRGWSAYLTVTSKAVPNASEEPIDLNQDDLEALYDAVLEVFDEDTATFIAAYRQNGLYTPPPPPEGDDEEGDAEEPPPIEQIGGRTVDLSQQGGQKFTSVLDIVGSLTQAQFDGERNKVVVESPLIDDPSSMAGYLPDLMANFTVGESDGTGRVNINQSCQTVLSSVPPMTETMAMSVLSQQDPGGFSADANYQFATWPLAFGLATVDEMKALLPFVSVSGGIFRAQVVGYSDIPGAFSRAEVVIDASEGSPKVVSWRDLTHLGPGFPLDTLILQR